MARIRVKFCGMTLLEDAIFAAKLGVDAVGLIFHPPSPRHVCLQKAKEIAMNMPPFVTRVGVVVNEARESIQTILHNVSLDVLQFHGDESAEFCRSFGKPYIKAIHIGDTPLVADYDRLYPDAIGFLFDTKVQNLPGGSGLTFNWENLPKLKRATILAGGLHINNITQAIKMVRPYCVDVTSGIEKEKGVKDHQKMNDFMNAVMDYSTIA